MKDNTDQSRFELEESGHLVWANYRIRDGKYASPNGNLVSTQPARISIPVKVLLVCVHNRRCFGQKRNLPQDVVTARAVIAHDLFFF